MTTGGRAGGVRYADDGRNRGKKGMEDATPELKGADFLDAHQEREREKKNRREKTKRGLRNGRKDFSVGPTWLERLESGGHVSWTPEPVDGGAVSAWRVRVPVTARRGRGRIRGPRGNGPWTGTDVVRGKHCCVRPGPWTAPM